MPIELFQDVHATVNTHVVPEGGELPSEEELAAMEALERGEPEAPAADESHGPRPEEALAAEPPAVEAPALEELAAEGPEAADETPDEPAPTAEGQADIAQAEPPAPAAAEETE